MNRIKKSDTVCVITGKDRGAIGEVLALDSKNGRVLVKGVNVITRHVKPRRQGEQGKIVKEEQYIHISNVMPVDASDKKPCRIRIQIAEGGKRNRVGHRSGQAL